MTASIRVTGSIAQDGDWIVFLPAGDSDCTHAATLRTQSGAQIEGGGIRVRMEQPGVHKACLSDQTSPWLDAHFSLLPGTILIVTTPQPPAPPLQTAQVEASFLIDATVESFNRTAFARQLAAHVGVAASDVTLTIEAASIRVIASIRTDTVISSSITAALATDVATLALTLGVSLQESPVLAVRTDAASDRLPTASPPPSLPLATTSLPVTTAALTEQQAASGADSTATILLVAFGAATVGFALVAAVVCRRSMRGQQRSPGVMVLPSDSRHEGKAPTPSPVASQARASDTLTSSRIPPLARTPSKLLPEAMDRTLLTVSVHQLRPMLKPREQWIPYSPGHLRAVGGQELLITENRLYLQQATGSSVDEGRELLVEQWSLSALLSLKRRRFQLRHTALELTVAAAQPTPAAQPGRSSHGGSTAIFLNFSSRDDRENAIHVLSSQRSQLRPPDESLGEATEQWRLGRMDNYSYLLRLNDCASRSFADLTQYPIM